MLMNLERLTDLREPSFSSPDFQVGVRNDTDGGKLGGKLQDFGRSCPPLLFKGKKKATLEQF